MQPHLPFPGPSELPPSAAAAAAHYMQQMYHPYNSYMQMQLQHELAMQQRAAGLPPPHPGYPAPPPPPPHQLPPKKEHQSEEEGRATPAAAAAAAAAAEQYGRWFHEQAPAPFNLESPCSRDIVELQRSVRREVGGGGDETSRLQQEGMRSNGSLSLVLL